MKCGGCSAAVKKILASSDLVDVAAVNLLTHTAAVRLHPSPTSLTDPTATATALAALVTQRGFPTTVRTPGDQSILFGLSASHQADRATALTRATYQVAGAWALALVCCSHHLHHLFHALGLHGIAHSEFFHVLGSPWVTGSLSAIALLGPGTMLVLVRVRGS